MEPASEQGSGDVVLGCCWKGTGGAAGGPDERRCLQVSPGKRQKRLLFVKQRVGGWRT